jgi:hypothetical protein
VHFRLSRRNHPLKIKKINADETLMASHRGRQQNHIWEEEEIQERLTTLFHHKPVTTSDKLMNLTMKTAYHSFNFLTGYTPINTPVKAMEWRLIVLESVAGVPGFVAAGFRHFRSLRHLERDHGWIHTLLEEAENERMHLLVCLNMFKASKVTRALVVAAQMLMTPFLAFTYILKPKACHRFVGYLEETACETYANVIQQILTPGTPLHEEWAQLPAPAMACSYWRLHPNALWVDTLKCIFADECNHRDINHTFADMASDDPNPFVLKHKEDADKAWRMDSQHVHSTVGVQSSTGLKEL